MQATAVPGEPNGGAGRPGDHGLWHGAARMDRNDTIAWALATGMWLGTLGLLLWLAVRERAPGTGRGLRVFLGAGLGAGVVLWAMVFAGARFAERKLGLREAAPPHAVRATAPRAAAK